MTTWENRPSREDCIEKAMKWLDKAEELEKKGYHDQGAGATAAAWIALAEICPSRRNNR